MARVGSITGLPQILSNLKTRSIAMAAGCERGVKLAALLLQRESQKLVPVDTGNLKASAFTRATGKGFGIEANVGYTAAYALYVHENREMKLKGQPRSSGRGNYWDPQGRGQSKFLEEPARRLRLKMRGIIQANMRVR